MGDFEKMMQQFASNPNLAKGFITASAAQLMADRTKATSETLANVSRGLSMLDDDILTTEEQLTRLKESPEGREQIATLGEAAASLQARTLSIVDRQTKFGEEYNKGMMALSLIGGEDAERGFKMLDMGKTDMLKRFDKLQQLPIENLKYRVLRNTFAYGNERVGAIKHDNKYVEYLNDIKGYLSREGSPLHQIRGGDYNTFSREEQANHDKLVSTIVSDANQKFGDIPKEYQGVITDAFGQVLDETNRTFTFKELGVNLRDTTGESRAAFLEEQEIIDTAFERIRNVEQQIKVLNPKSRGLLSYYLKNNGFPPEGSVSRTIDGVGSAEDGDVDLAQIKRLANLVRVGSQYYQDYNTVGRFFPTLNRRRWMENITPEGWKQNAVGNLEPLAIKRNNLDGTQRDMYVNGFMFPKTDTSFYHLEYDDFMNYDELRPDNELEKADEDLPLGSGVPSDTEAIVNDLIKSYSNNKQVPYIVR